MKRLTVPEKLYGREKEIEFLFDSFQKICKGVGEVLTVPGVSGVGKTALVRKLEAPVLKENGFFISGKFEQYQQNIPYFAFRQALSNICHILIAEDDAIREQYKTDILEAIGTQGQVLIDLVPEFETLLGKQPPLGDISPQEARHRFTDVLRRFLQVICLPEHPLVLFIDDWQWGDTASLELLKQLDIGNALRYILVIISYRDNEVNSGHPLTTTLADLKRENIPLKTLKVKNLTRKNILDILSDTLQSVNGDAEILAGFIHEKTQGNPFFIHSAIYFLFDNKQLWLNESKNMWEWEIDEKERADFPNNVVALFVRKFLGMDKKAQKIFSLAACLGNRFSLHYLAIISGLKEKECKKTLNSDKGNEVVAPLATDKEKAIAANNAKSDDYIFRHDKLQQAAFSMIDQENLSGILLKIGRLLLSEMSPGQLNKRLFEVINALNAGIDLIDQTEEKEKLFKLNLQAAQKAYAATAYSASLQYYHAAEKLLSNKTFADFIRKNHPELLGTYLKEHALCEFLEGDHQIAEKCVHEAVKISGKAVGKADAYNILIVQYTLQARYAEAISSAKLALSGLGINLPEKGYDKARDKELDAVRRLLKDRDIASLYELPKMTDPEMLMACKILITMGPPCYRADQKLWSVIVPVVVKLTLQYGNIPQVGYSHTAIGGLMGWVDDDYATAKEFSELATRLMTEKFTNPSAQSVFYLMIGSSNRHWFKHLKHSSQDYIDAYEIGLRSGNLQYAAYAFGHNVYCRFYQGSSLEALIAETKGSLEFSKTRHNQWAIDLFNGALKVFDVLRSENDTLPNPLIQDEQYLKKVDDHKNIQVKCIYKVLKTYSLFVLNRYEDALVLSEETEPIIYTVGTQGLLPWPEFVFAQFLIRTKLYQGKEVSVQIEWLSELKQVLEKLRIWADYSPENFEHKYLLAAAELARIENKPAEALQNYHKAVELAHDNGFVQWEGVANEMIYNFWIEHQNYHLAFHYWKQAYICYQHWGALAKLKIMEDDYTIYLKQSFSEIQFEQGNDEKKNSRFKQWLIDKQLGQVRNLAFKLHQSKLQQDSVRLAGELAESTKRLRAEMVIRKQVEDELKHKNRELEKLNNEKDKFFSIISHDLKSPFNSVQGFSDLIVERVREKDMENIELFALQIQQSSNKAMELLNNLMEWSRAQTGRIKFNPSRFDLADLLIETKLLYEAIADQKNITISNKISFLVPVVADKEMISTVLRNLVSNAIKFTPPGGAITFDAEIINDDVMFRITDTGIGISPKNIDKLFRIDSDYTTPGTNNEKGTGLGLILCKEFVAKHGGTIDLKSEEGKGSTFQITLPQRHLETEKK